MDVLERAARDGVAIGARIAVNGRAETILYRRGRQMTWREAQDWLADRQPVPTRVSLLRRIAKAARRLATHGSASDGQ